MHTLKLCAIFLLSSITIVSHADRYVQPPDGENLIGKIQLTQTKHEDTLLDIARQFDLGQNEILIANPGVDRWIPGEKTRVLLPTRFILPNAPRQGIVVNIPEMRLYYFTKDKQKQSVVITHPISVGRMDWNTPLGLTRIIAKQKDPSWRPPDSIKEEHALDGDILPDVVPAGPDNPLGQYAIRLAVPGYLIHSTNKPFGIGMRVTHGCVRMYPTDIEKLFEQVEINTSVRIVNQQIKFGRSMDKLYIEVSPGLEENNMNYTEALAFALDIIDKESQSISLRVDGNALRTALEERNGIPVAIAHRSADDSTHKQTHLSQFPKLL